MRKMTWSTGRGLVFLTLLVIVASTVASAAVTLTVSTEYQGVEGDSQAVKTTVKFSPEGSEAENITIDVGETNRGFVDYASFTKKINPGTSDAQVRYVGQGVYKIDQLDPSETVTITFKAYPRTIKEQSLHVANVDASYTQNGQELSTSKQVEADLSESSWFSYQDARQTAEQRRIPFYGSLAVIGLGVVYAGWRGWRKISGDGFDEDNNNGF